MAAAATNDVPLRALVVREDRPTVMLYLETDDTARYPHGDIDRNQATRRTWQYEIVQAFGTGGVQCSQQSSAQKPMRCTAADRGDQGSSNERQDNTERDGNKDCRRTCPDDSSGLFANVSDGRRQRKVRKTAVRDRG